MSHGNHRSRRSRRLGFEVLETRVLLNADTMASAIQVGTLSGTRTYHDSVSANDVDYYFRFHLAQPSMLDLTLTGVVADADVRLLSSDGGRIAGSARGDGADEAIRQVLQEGIYFVHVRRYSGNMPYTLTLGATPLA